LPTYYRNAISTCSQKVRLTLAEKEIEFDSSTIHLLADVGVIPYLFRLENARMDGFWNT
jgi:glutathione S-transferase